MSALEIRIMAYGVLLALIGAAAAIWHHDAVEKGIAEQRAADTAATAKLQSETAAQTAALAAQATAAEHSHDQELADLRAYRDAHPISVHASDLGGKVVPPASAAPTGAKAAGAAPTPVQQVPAGDHSVQPGQPSRDLGTLLDAFGAAADEVSGRLREAEAILP